MNGHGGFEKAARSALFREAPLRSRQRRADARFEWLIFFLLFASPPHPHNSSLHYTSSPPLTISLLSAEDETTSALMEDISPLIMINL